MSKPLWGRLPLIVAAGVSATLAIALADDISTDQSAGTIALISGKAWVRHGLVVLPTPENEAQVSPSVTFTDQTGRELGPNDHVLPGDVVVTGENSYLKIYYRDDSIMDVGPETTFKVTQFNLAPSSRQISFTLLAGKVRTLVTRALEPTSFYRVDTPTSSMGVHGTEWVTNSYSQNGQYRTDVTVLEGKVVVDAPKPNFGGGRSNVDQVAVTPGHTFSGVGNGGSVSKFSVFKMSNDQMKELAAMVPNIETKRVGNVAALAGSPTTTTTPEGTRAIASNPPAAAQQPATPIAAAGATSVSFNGNGAQPGPAQHVAAALPPPTPGARTLDMALAAQAPHTNAPASTVSAAAPVQFTGSPHQVAVQPTFAAAPQAPTFQTAAASPHFSPAPVAPAPSFSTASAVQAAVAQPAPSTVVMSASAATAASMPTARPIRLRPAPTTIAPPVAAAAAAPVVFTPVRH